MWTRSHPAAYESEVLDAPLVLKRLGVAKNF
jgi:hypothetical protein